MVNYKKNHIETLLFIAIISFSHLVFGIVNTNVSEKDIPPYVCDLEFLTKNGKPIAHCSGTLINSNTILSSAHCEFAYKYRGAVNANAFCANNSISAKVDSHELLLEQKLDNALDMDATLKDIALFHLKDNLKIPHAIFLAKDAYKQFLEKSVQSCAVFGIGAQKQNNWHPTGQIFNRWDLEGYSNPKFFFHAPHPSIVHGDSGGTYTCKMQSGKWRLVGVNIGEVLGGESAVSVYKNLDWISQKTSIEFGE